MELGPYTARVLQVSVDPTLIGLVVGPGGKTIRGIESDTGVVITQSRTDGRENMFSISANAWEPAQRAKKTILGLVEVPEVGKIYKGSKVVGVENFGVFVEFLPGRQGLLHTSELATGETLATFKEGDIVDVFLAGIDGLKFKLSRSKLPGRTGRGGAADNSGGSGNVVGEAVDPPPPGTLIRGMRIVTVKEFGWFVENDEGLKGLVHFSEQYRPGEKRDSLCAGDSIDAILLDSRGRDLGKLSFSRKQAVKMLQEQSAAAA